jgi:hypothetical protein
MTKKDLLIGGWVGIGQLLVEALQTAQCINNRIFVIKSFKMTNFTNVELYRGQYPDRVVPNSKTFTSTVQRLSESGKFYPRMEDRGRDRSQILEGVEANPGITTLG